MCECVYILFCPINVVTCADTFHTLNVTNTMRQRLYNKNGNDADKEEEKINKNMKMIITFKNILYYKFNLSRFT